MATMGDVAEPAPPGMGDPASNKGMGNSLEIIPPVSLAMRFLSKVPSVCER